MTATKASITVNEDLMTWAKKAAKAQGVNLSQFVTEALAAQKRGEAIDRLVKKGLQGKSAKEIERARRQVYLEFYPPGEEDVA